MYIFFFLIVDSNVSLLLRCSWVIYTSAFCKFTIQSYLNKQVDTRLLMAEVRKLKIIKN